MTGLADDDLNGVVRRGPVMSLRTMVTVGLAALAMGGCSTAAGALAAGGPAGGSGVVHGCRSNTELSQPRLAMIWGSSTLERTPGSAAHTYGMALTGRCAVAPGTGSGAHG
ncbi:MAG: hypothetical protein J2P57_06305 [Acidimicrobiaceae bacterium]|nr:hypothetical protein [Acidimicrobiaceae bacterium]